MSFTTFFLIMAAYYVLKAVRGPIFLRALGIEWFPVFLVLNALVSFAAAGLFGRLADLVRKRTLITGIQGFFVANLVGFWLLLKLFPITAPDSSWTKLASASFTLWIGVFVLFAVTPFWSLVNELVRPDEGKRLFGFIGAGGILGGIVGGQLAHALAEPLGTVNLIPLSAGLLALTIPLFLVMMRVTPPAGEATGGQGRLATTKGAFAGLATVRRDGYVAMIAAVVVSSTFIQTFIDYQFHAAVNETIATTDAQTAYFGLIQSHLNLASFAMQMAVTPLVLSRLGVGAALAILPTVAFVGALVTLGGAGLHTLAVVYIASFAALYSVHQASKELLYVPCDADVKYKAKAFIDAFGYRLGAAGCGIVTQVAQAAGVAFRHTSVLVAVVSALWLPLVVAIQRRFRQATEGAARP